MTLPDHTTRDTSMQPERGPTIRRLNRVLVVLAVIALAAYCAPWLDSHAAALSLNGYDLAEWSSLAPGVRFGTQPMVIPGLLRAQLLFAAAIVALLPIRRRSPGWWLAGAAALALIVAQLPPFEYFLHVDWRADVNYGQQFTLSLLGLIDAAVCWLLPRLWQRRAALVGFAGAGIVTALAGATQAVQAAAQLGTPAAVGIGVYAYCAALAGIAVIAVVMPSAPLKHGNKKRAHSAPPLDQVQVRSTSAL